ncbi:MAG TPA: zf-HC2 domain-containing protein [Gemmatimonadaceae bacterium]|nr:zf-HC2 domain-containing protein [Gemmatimonadaceae bacterium]
MNHLDEATIHAWLDGALDATQARDTEAHVAACATCAANVAEARGLIAGASRILIALDDVPGDVIPKRMPPALPAAPRPPGVLAGPRRQWRAARWVTGIAAALMLAIGVTTWNRGAVTEQDVTAAFVQSPKPDSETSLRASAPVAPDAQHASAPSSSLPPKAASPEVAQRSAGAAAPAPAVGAATLARTARAREERISAPADRDLAAGRGAGGAASAEAPAAMQKKTPQAVTLNEVVAPPANQSRADAPSSASRATAGAVSPPPPAALALGYVALDLADFIGCYQGVAGGAPKFEDVVATSAPASTSDEARTAARRRASTSTPAAAAPSPAAAREAASVPVLSLVVRLDSTRVDTAYAVRRAGTPLLIGRWSPVGPDSVRIAAGGRVVTLPRTARVTCP